MRIAVRGGVFLLRHLLALAGLVALGCFFWTVVYFGLLLWALTSGGGIGGPLAYPAGLVVVFCLGVGAGLGLLLPATALAEWLVGRRHWPVLAQIPVSVALLVLICSAIVFAGSGELSTGFLNQLAIVGVLVALNLVPLGIYWWIAQSGPLIWSGLARWKSRKIPLLPR